MNNKKEKKFTGAILNFLFEYNKINFLIRLSQHLHKYAPIINLLSLIKMKKKNKKNNLKHVNQILSVHEKIKKIELKIINLYIPTHLQKKFQTTITENSIYFNKSKSFSKLCEYQLKSLIIEIIPKNIIETITDSNLEYSKKIKLIATLTHFGNPETGNFNSEIEESLAYEEVQNYFLEKEIKTKLKLIIESIEKLTFSIYLNAYKIAKLKPKKIDFIDIWISDYYKELKNYKNIQSLYQYQSTSFSSRLFLIQSIIKKSHSDNFFNQKLDYKKTGVSKNDLNNIITNTLFIECYNRMISKNMLEKENEYHQVKQRRLNKPYKYTR